MERIDALNFDGMGLQDTAKKKHDKYLLFEYFMFSLYKWNKEMDSSCKAEYTKLQLHKLLFFASAIDTTAVHHEMLDIFSRFYALPYGPVELDIYEAMKKGKIGCISVSDRLCMLDSVADNYFEDLDMNLRNVVDMAITNLKRLNVNYFTMPPFQLVEISHCWTAWRDAYSFAMLCGSKQEPMSVEAICKSDVKYFGE